MAWTKIIPPQSFFLGVSRRRGGKPQLGIGSLPGPTDSPATKAPQIWPHRCVVQCDPCHDNRQQQSWATSLAASVPKPEPRSSLAGWVEKSWENPTNQPPKLPQFLLGAQGCFTQLLGVSGLESKNCWMTGWLKWSWLTWTLRSKPMWKRWFVLRNLQHSPGMNIPQALNYLFMKDVLSFGGLGMPGVCCKGMLGSS